MKKGMKLLRNMIIGLLVVICAVAAVVVVITVFGDGGDEATLERRPVDRVGADRIVHQTEDNFFWQSALQKAVGEELWRYYPLIPKEAEPGDIVKLSAPALGFVAWEADPRFADVKFTAEPSEESIVRMSFVVPEEDFQIRALYTDMPNESDDIIVLNPDGIEHGTLPPEFDRGDEFLNRDDSDEDNIIYNFRPTPLRYGMFGNDYGFRPGQPESLWGENIILTGYSSLDAVSASITGFSGSFGGVGAPVPAEDYNMWFDPLAMGMGFRIHGRPLPLDGWFEDDPVFPTDAMHFRFNVTVRWRTRQFVPEVPPVLDTREYIDGDPNPEFGNIITPGIPAVTEQWVSHVRPFTFKILPRPDIIERDMPDGMIGVRYGDPEVMALLEPLDPFNTRIRVHVPQFPEFPTNPFIAPTDPVPDPGDPDAPPITPGSPGDGDWYRFGGTQWRFSIIDNSATGYTFTVPGDIAGEHPFVDIAFMPPPTFSRDISLTVRLEAVAQHPAQVQIGLLRDPDRSGSPGQILIGTIERTFTITILPRPSFVTAFDGLPHAMDGTLRYPSASRPELSEPADTPYSGTIRATGFPTRLVRIPDPSVIGGIREEFQFTQWHLAYNGDPITNQLDNVPGMNFNRSPGLIFPTEVTPLPDGNNGGENGNGSGAGNSNNIGPVGEYAVSISGTPMTFGDFPVNITFSSMHDPNPNIRTEIAVPVPTGATPGFNLRIWPRTYLYIDMGFGNPAAFVTRVTPGGESESFNEVADAPRYVERRAVMPGTLGMIISHDPRFVRWEHNLANHPQPHVPPIGGPAVPNSGQPGHWRTTTHNYMVMRMPVDPTGPGTLASPVNLDVYIRGFPTINPLITLPDARDGMVGQLFARSLNIRADDLGDVGQGRNPSWELISWNLDGLSDPGFSLSVDPSTGRFTEVTGTPTLSGELTFTVGVNLRGTMQVQETFSVMIRPRPGIILGDVDDSGDVNYLDVITLARYLGLRGTPNAIELSERGRNNADIGRKGFITGDDLTRLLEIFAIYDERLPNAPDAGD
ncbi:MAG: hypothetical protein FWC20_09090 [Oscillospiraceae bacterium]|nr:hypothetical protein [Oscillospiraceae bacterium]